MSATARDTLVQSALLYDELTAAVDERTLEILERRRKTGTIRRRGWLIRRALLLADVVALALAFAAAQLLGSANPNVGAGRQIVYFLVTLPGWVVVAKLHGLYDRDEERTDHTTVEDVVGVFQVVTIGTWLFFVGAKLMKFAGPNVTKLIVFWALAFCLVTLGRIAARTLCRRSIAYLQNTIIVGAGDVGQLVARKLLHHPEYRINLVGFVDAEPKDRRPDLEHLTLLGPPERLPAIIRLLDVERVIVAFSKESQERMLEIVRALKDLDVQVDIVPRFFEVVGPNVGIHTVEGLPLVGLPPVKLSPSSRLIKRAIDIVGALVGLIVAAPLFAYVAWRIKRNSPGPVFFRQTRLGLNMKEFTALKFRTMRADTSADEHREYVRATMNPSAPEENGLYKLERKDAVTNVGRWLRRTSLDELPQLINVLRGDMSLVGPRPCIPYETEYFAPHHFERFLVPAGITGLWQVMARAHSTFREALDMDVAYARGWSLGLDLRLLFRTPLQLLRPAGTR